jgi:hypothetical protein
MKQYDWRLRPQIEEEIMSIRKRLWKTAAGEDRLAGPEVGDETRKRLRMTKRPNIPPKVLRDLEKFGVEPIKIKLMHQPSNEPDGVLRFDNATAQFSEIRDWLKWREAKEAYRRRAGDVVGIITMVAALFAAWFSYLSLLK